MFRPRIKPEHRPVRYGEDRVRIGGIVPGIAADILDPDGSVWALFEALDGTRTVDQVVTGLVHRFTTMTAAQVRARVEKDLRDLVEAGHVEDAAAPVPNELSMREQERYSRGQGFWRWSDRTPRASSWEPQMLLRQARVVVVGIGGVGATAALSLALSGVGQMHCVDPDVVELSDLNRHVLFTEEEVGRAKADAAVARLRQHNSDITVTGERLTITSPAGLAALAERFDVVVLAADQPSDIRFWTNQACTNTGTAWVHGGYHGPQVNIGIYRPGAGPCYECAYVAERQRLVGLPPRTPAPVTTQVPQASNAVSAGVAGQLVAHATMSLITDIPRMRTNCEYGINLANLADKVVLGPDAPHPDCPICAPTAG